MEKTISNEDDLARLQEVGAILTAQHERTVVATKRGPVVVTTVP